MRRATTHPPSGTESETRPEAVGMRFRFGHRQLGSQASPRPCGRGARSPSRDRARAAMRLWPLQTQASPPITGRVDGGVKVISTPSLQGHGWFPGRSDGVYRSEYLLIHKLTKSVKTKLRDSLHLVVGQVAPGVVHADQEKSNPELHWLLFTACPLRGGPIASLSVLPPGISVVNNRHFDRSPPSRRPARIRSR